MTLRSPCMRCGVLLHTGEGKVIVGHTADDLEQLAAAVGGQLRQRLLCALGVLDPEREAKLRAELGDA